MRRRPYRRGGGVGNFENRYNLSILAVLAEKQTRPLPEYSHTATAEREKGRHDGHGNRRNADTVIAGRQTGMENRFSKDISTNTRPDSAHAGG